MTDLRELEKRLEEATGPDRELDVALSQMGYDMSEYVAQRRVGYFVHKDCLDNPDKGEWDVAHFTASLDAAVALVERMGFFYRLQKETPVGQKAFLAKYWATVGPAGAQEAANAETGPVALMLALIRALIAKE